MEAMTRSLAALCSCRITTGVAIIEGATVLECVELGESALLPMQRPRGPDTEARCPHG
jgi:hypothetical protein